MLYEVINTQTKMNRMAADETAQDECAEYDPNYE